MGKNIRKLLRPLLFAAGGMLAGYLYYRFVGCASGTCAITSNPVNSMFYMGMMGLLVSAVSEKREAEEDNRDNQEE